MDAALIPDYTQRINEIFFPFIRVSSFFMVIPIIGTQLITQRVRLILSIAVTVAIMPQISEIIVYQPMTMSWILAAIKEILIGLLLGFIIQFLFQLLVIGGQTIAMQSGLGFAQLMDPVNGVSVAAISQLYLLMANIFFFSSNAHLSVIQILTQTFESFPVGVNNWPVDALMQVVNLGSWMFASGLLIALPIVVALLLLNITFGVISRLSPQFNVFSFGFAFIVLCGIVLVMVTLPRILPHFNQFTLESLNYMREIML